MLLSPGQLPVKSPEKRRLNPGGGTLGRARAGPGTERRGTRTWRRQICEDPQGTPAGLHSASCRGSGAGCVGCRRLTGRQERPLHPGVGTEPGAPRHLLSLKDVQTPGRRYNCSGPSATIRRRFIRLAVPEPACAGEDVATRGAFAPLAGVNTCGCHGGRVAARQTRKHGTACGPSSSASGHGPQRTGSRA